MESAAQTAAADKDAALELQAEAAIEDKSEAIELLEKEINAAHAEELADVRAELTKRAAENQEAALEAQLEMLQASGESNKNAAVELARAENAPALAKQKASMESAFATERAALESRAEALSALVADGEARNASLEEQLRDAEHAGALAAAETRKTRAELDDVRDEQEGRFQRLRAEVKVWEDACVKYRKRMEHAERALRRLKQRAGAAGFVEATQPEEDRGGAGRYPDADRAGRERRGGNEPSPKPFAADADADPPSPLALAPPPALAPVAVRKRARDGSGPDAAIRAGPYARRERTARPEKPTENPPRLPSASARLETYARPAAAEGWRRPRTSKARGFPVAGSSAAGESPEGLWGESPEEKKTRPNANVRESNGKKTRRAVSAARGSARRSRPRALRYRRRARAAGRRGRLRRSRDDDTTKTRRGTKNVSAPRGGERNRIRKRNQTRRGCSRRARAREAPRVCVRGVREVLRGGRARGARGQTRRGVRALPRPEPHERLVQAPRALGAAARAARVLEPRPDPRRAERAVTPTYLPRDARAGRCLLFDRLTKR